MSKLVTRQLENINCTFFICTPKKNINVRHEIASIGSIQLEFQADHNFSIIIRAWQRQIAVLISSHHVKCRCVEYMTVIYHYDNFGMMMKLVQ